MPDFLGMTAICLSSEQNFQQPGFLNIPCLQPSEPPLQGALHPVVATVGGPQLRAQDKEQGPETWPFKGLSQATPDQSSSVEIG